MARLRTVLILQLAVIMDEISSILVAIKEIYFKLKASHRKHYSCHLKNVERFELQESKGDCDVVFGHSSANEKQVLSITYNNLFSGEYANRAILVHGEVGVGKTMLCLSILEDWASGKLFQEFYIILYLPIRNVASACSLSELLSILYPDFKPDTCAKMVTYLEKNENHSTLIIADGWEDLQPSQCQTGSFFHSLLFSNDIVPISPVTVLITTTKPYCMQKHTLELIGRFTILNGFDRTAVESIIQSEFEGDIRMIRYFTAQFNENPLIASVCSKPLHLAILCDLCRSSIDAKLLPKFNTKTDLYAKLVWTLAAMSIRNNDSHKSVLNLSKYDDFPRELLKPWQFLCELAFRNIKGGHKCYIISPSDTTSSELKTFSYFGLIKPISENGDALSFSFLHPYFEQYLASLHLALQPHEDQVTLMQELVSENTEWDSTIFWHFFVCNYVSMVANVKSDIIQQVLKIISSIYHSYEGSYIVNLCNLSFEAMNSTVSHQIISEMDKLAMDKKLLKFGHCRNVQDCIAMIYVIENIRQEHEIEINFQDCYLSPEHINSLAIALGNNSSTVQVRGLDLSNTK